MLQYLFQPGAAPGPDKEIWLIFGVRSEADILYRDEFESMARKHQNFHFVPTLSRPGKDWQGHTGYVQTQVERYLASKRGLHAYVCGLTRMLDDVRQRLETMGYGPEAISCERYD